MKLQQLFALSTLTLAATFAMADTDSSNNHSLTRAEVRQSVIEARNAGELIPAGEAADFPRASSSAPSTLTHSQVRQEVLAARAAGELIPAGEDADPFEARSAPLTFSGLTRADVRADTLRARDAGQLTPAGEADATTVAHEAAQTRYARAAWLARHPTSDVTVGLRSK